MNTDKRNNKPIVLEKVQGYVVCFSEWRNSFVVVDTTREKYRVLPEDFRNQLEAKLYAESKAFKEVIRNRSSMRM